MKARGSTTARGYGHAHQAERRAALAALVDGDRCWRCGRAMSRGMPLDLDHRVPLALGGQGERRLTHRSCNRAAGARLKEALRLARLAGEVPPPRRAAPRRRLGKTPLPGEIRTSREW